MKIKIVNKSTNQLPEYATIGSAGMDLRANLESPVVIKPGQRTLIPTGLHISLPVGYEAQIRPRSGLALKKGVSAHLGTIDSDYRGDCGVILFNQGSEDFIVNHGDRVAQMVIARYEKAEWEATDSLDETDRGEGGFGHSGTK